MGMFGAFVELLVKACLDQAYGVNAMYKEGDVEPSAYKFGRDCINELKKAVKNDEKAISFIWKKQRGCQ